MATSRDALARRLAVVVLVATVAVGAAALWSALLPDRQTRPTNVEADIRDRTRSAERADRSERRTAPDRVTPSAAGSASTPTASPGPATPTPAATRPAENAQPSPAEDAQPNPAQTSARSSNAATGPSGTTPKWVHPMPGASTTSCYGQRWGVLHAGIDLAQPAGTPVRAAGAGTVSEAGWIYPGYGISVIIDHGDGVLTHYAHLSEETVDVGQRLAAGEILGSEGSTGDSTGPHLHFEVHQGLWNQLDPGPWMRERGVDLGC